MQEQPNEQQQPKGPNERYIINSLQNQLAQSAYKIAEGDAIIAEMTIRMQELKKDNENLREELKNKGGGKNNK